MSKETECPTVSSPLLQKEKPQRLFADIAADSEWFENQSSTVPTTDVPEDIDPRMQKLEKLCAGIEVLCQRMDAYAKRRGYNQQ